MANLTYEQVAKTIDHSLLRPELDLDFVRDGVELARRYGVASATVRPADVAFAADLLKGSDVFVSTVVGFPHGSSSTETKAFEAERAVELGAREIDMVLNIGRLCSAARRFVDDIQRPSPWPGERRDRQGDLRERIPRRHAEGARLPALRRSRRGFVKTSTGFAPSGATIDDLKLMRRCVGPHVQVKAAGGIRTLDALLEVMAVGVTRIGATATETMLEDFKARKAALEPAPVG